MSYLTIQSLYSECDEFYRKDVQNIYYNFGSLDISFIKISCGENNQIKYEKCTKEDNFNAISFPNFRSRWKPVSIHKMHKVLESLVEKHGDCLILQQYCPLYYCFVNANENKKIIIKKDISIPSDFNLIKEYINNKKTELRQSIEDFKTLCGNNDDDKELFNMFIERLAIRNPDTMFYVYEMNVYFTLSEFDMKFEVCDMKYQNLIFLKLRQLEQLQTQPEQLQLPPQLEQLPPQLEQLPPQLEQLPLQLHIEHFPDSASLAGNTKKVFPLENSLEDSVVINEDSTIEIYMISNAFYLSIDEISKIYNVPEDISKMFRKTEHTNIYSCYLTDEELTKLMKYSLD